MRFVEAYSHHNGQEAWAKREKIDWLTDLFEAPKVNIVAKSTTAIRNHLRAELEADGWAFNVRVDPEADLTVFARKNDLVIQLQTGNISRYAYDLLKIQHLYVKREIEAAALAVPTKAAADRIGSNVAHIERIWNELNIFDREITVPILVIAFE